MDSDTKLQVSMMNQDIILRIELQYINKIKLFLVDGFLYSHHFTAREHIDIAMGN